MISEKYRVVTQNHYLHDTIRNNICFGSEEYDNNNLTKAAEIANAYDLLET